MKVKTILLLVLVFCIGVMTGCQCEHEWKEADCLTPKTCTLCDLTEGEASGHSWSAATCTAPKTCAACGETEGTALGHSWTEATCSAPETCSACGETQGDTLAHTPGDWSDNGDGTMGSTCTVCGIQENVPIDHKVLLGQLLEGHWDFNYYLSEDQYYDVHQLAPHDTRPYIQFSRDCTGTFYSGESHYPIHLEKYVLREDEESGTHYVLNVCADTATLTLLLSRLYSEDYELVLYTSNTSLFAFSRHADLAASVTGIWYTFEDNRFHRLELNADRTVTGTLFGQNFSGLWLLKPVQTSQDGSRSTEITLCSAEGDIIAYSPLNLGYEGFGIGASDLSMYIHAVEGSRYAEYRQVDKETFARLEDALKESAQKISGLWASDNEEYSITFAEDGTFTAALDMECKGTWTVKDIHESNGDIYCDYRITFADTQETVRLTIDANGDLWATGYGRDFWSDIKFYSQSEEAIAAREAALAEAAGLLAGTWTGYTCETYSYSNDGIRHNGKMRYAFDYSITFSADGTFETVLDRNYTGTWRLDFKNVYDDSDYHSIDYAFILNFDGISETAEACLNIEGTSDPSTADVAKNGRFSMTFNQHPNYADLYFLQLSTAELDQIRNASEQLVGTWSAVSAKRFVLDPEASTDEIPHYTSTGEIPDFSYSLSVAADGTYTVFWDRTETGTCVYVYDSDPCSLPRYQFYSVNSRNWYYMQEDGTIEIDLYGDSDDSFIQLRLKKD